MSNRTEMQGLIFDLGHTLMHLDATWSQVFDRGAADLAAFIEVQGLEVDGHAFARTLLDLRQDGYARAAETGREVTATDTMRQAFARFNQPDPGPALLRGAIDAFFAYEESRWFADPEALPVLRELAHRGFRLGMFSNATDDPFIQELVDRLGFRPLLQPALSSAGTGIRKPDPAAFDPILAAWELPAGAVTVVGDTLHADILGAQRAGMRSVWYSSRTDARQEGTLGEHTASLESIRPDATITRLGELTAVVERF